MKTWLTFFQLWKEIVSELKIEARTVAPPTTGRRRVLAFKASIAPSRETEWSFSNEAQFSNKVIYNDKISMDIRDTETRMFALHICSCKNRVILLSNYTFIISQLIQLRIMINQKKLVWLFLKSK